jgi:hypothetical protein
LRKFRKLQISYADCGHGDATTLSEVQPKKINEYNTFKEFNVCGSMWSLVYTLGGNRLKLFINFSKSTCSSFHIAEMGVSEKPDYLGETH